MSGGPPFYGRWPVNSVYEARLDNTWVDATPQRAIVSGTPAPSFTKTEYAGYVVMTFTSSGTVTFTGDFGGTGEAMILSGGGPGSGGFAAGYDPSTGTVYYAGGPGGSGGTLRTSPFSVQANTPIPITVGGAGAASSVGPLSSSPGTSGGAGGRGRNAPGSSPVNGSSGLSNDYRTGSNQVYAGGGGGGGTGFYFAGPGAFSGQAGGSGADGGGGGGWAAYGGGPAQPGSAGGSNTGGGGGGGGAHDSGSGIGQSISYGSGGAGGSGIVVMRFPTVDFRAS